MRWLALHTTVIAMWLWVHAAVGSWLVRSWWLNEGQLHVVLAVALLVGAATAVDPVAVLDRLSLPPRRSLAALALAALPPLVAAFLVRTIPVDALPALAAVVSAYGLAGLFLTQAAWRRLLPAAGLAALWLPLSSHLDIVLGYPLRWATAAVVATALGPAEVTAGTVLAVDGAFAHVDLPCSGVQSLWSGLVVLLGAAVVWGRPVGARFGAIAVAVLAGLLVANASRVLTLVTLLHVVDWPLLADVLHVPLGVIGFVLAVAPGLWAIRRLAEPDVAEPDRSAEKARSWATVAVGVALIATVGVQALPAAERAVARPVTLPDTMVSVVPTPQEAAFAAEHGASVRKARFARDGLRGTVVVVTSRSWLAHHVPTWCLRAGGWTLSGERPVHLDQTLVRWAEAERSGTPAVALWWFQSAGRQTDDHTERILRGLVDDEAWVLVSVVLEGATPPEAAVPLVHDLRASVAQSLEDA
ncbi:MAG: exosortase O [Myxococcales bacterium]|nr:exosortase O [Myxococcales bacterium]